MREEGIKDDFRVIDLSNWKDRVATYWNGEDHGISLFGENRIGFEGDWSFDNQKLPFGILVLKYLLRTKTQKKAFDPLLFLA